MVNDSPVAKSKIRRGEWGVYHFNRRRAVVDKIPSGAEILKPLLI